MFKRLRRKCITRTFGRYRKAVLCKECGKVSETLGEENSFVISELCPVCGSEDIGVAVVRSIMDNGSYVGVEVNRRL